METGGLLIAEQLSLNVFPSITDTVLITFTYNPVDVSIEISGVSGGSEIFGGEKMNCVHSTIRKHNHTKISIMRMHNSLKMLITAAQPYICWSLIYKIFFVILISFPQQIFGACSVKRCIWWYCRKILLWVFWTDLTILFRFPSPQVIIGLYFHTIAQTFNTFQS